MRNFTAVSPDCLLNVESLNYKDSMACVCVFLFFVTFKENAFVFLQTCPFDTLCRLYYDSTTGGLSTKCLSKLRYMMFFFVNIFLVPFFVFSLSLSLLCTCTSCYLSTPHAYFIYIYKTSIPVHNLYCCFGCDDRERFLS